MVKRDADLRLLPPILDFVHHFDTTKPSPLDACSATTPSRTDQHTLDTSHTAARQHATFTDSARRWRREEAGPVSSPPRSCWLKKLLKDEPNAWRRDGGEIWHQARVLANTVLQILGTMGCARLHATERHCTLRYLKQPNQPTRRYLQSSHLQHLPTDTRTDLVLGCANDFLL